MKPRQIKKNSKSKELAIKSIDHYVENIIITSVSYLGYMTEKEFNDN